MKNRKTLVTFLLTTALLLSIAAPVFGAASPTLTAQQSANNFTVSLSDIPANTTSIQFDITTSKSFTSATMSWSTDFDFKLVKTNGNTMTVYIDNIIPLTTNGNLNVGKLTLSGLQKSTNLTGGYMKLVAADYTETVYQSTNTNFTPDNNWTGSTTSPDNSTPDPRPTMSPTTQPTNPNISTETLKDGVYNLTFKSNYLSDTAKSATPVLDLTKYASVSATIDNVSLGAFIAATKPIEIRVKNASYFLDVSKVPSDKYNLSGASLEMVIKELPKTAGLESAPIEFALYIQKDGKKTEVTTFGDYIKRTINFTSAKSNLQAVKILGDNTTTPVISTITTNGANKTATVWSLTNSAYAITEQKPVDLTKITGNWAYNDIAAFAQSGIISDYANFTPTEAITRAEFTDIITRAMGIYDISTAPIPFTDVTSTTPFKNGIISAKLFSVVAGYDDLTFRPDGKITRQEVAKIIGQLFKLADFNIDPNTDMNNLTAFNDYGLLGDWVARDMSVLIHNKIMFGDDLNNLNPLGNITKAETISLIARLRSIVTKK